jgi:hypothetical protein
MASEFVWSTHIFFWTLLLAICLLFFTYYEKLRDDSLGLMVALQLNKPASDAPWQITFAEGLENWTNIEGYYLLIFMAYPFLCRQRFFYYLAGFVGVDVVKNIIKLGFHMPRPIWIWP